MQQLYADPDFGRAALMFIASLGAMVYTALCSNHMDDRFAVVSLALATICAFGTFALVVVATVQAVASFNVYPLPM